MIVSIGEVLADMVGKKREKASVLSVLQVAHRLTLRAAWQNWVEK